MTIIRKIRNKERCKLRGPKLRSSVFRAEYNAYWERVNKAMVETLCKDHGLKIEDHLSSEPRNTWEHTYDDLRRAGYWHVSKSIRMHMADEELAEEQRKIEKFLLWNTGNE